MFGAAADLSVTKTATPDPVVAGAELTYTITVTNSGPAPAVNVLVSDLLPATLSVVSVTANFGGSCNAGIPGSMPTTCTFATLADGDSRTMTIVTLVDPATPDGTIISNNTSTSSDTLDPNNLNNIDTTTTTVITSADLSLTKSDAPDPALAGGNLTYVLSIANAGPSFARQVTVSDTLPAQLTFVSATIGGGTGSCSPVGSPTVVQCALGDLANGDARTVTIQTTVASSVPHGTVINNTAAVTSATSDPSAANNTDTESTTIHAQSDLWLDKTAVLLTGNPSRSVRFTLSVYNKPGCEADDQLSCGTGGPSDAQSVVVTDVLPLDSKKLKVVFVSENCAYDLASHTVTCTLQSALPAGQLASFIIDVQVQGSVGSFSNRARVTTSTQDPNPNNNEDVVQMIMKGGSSHQ